MNLEAMAAKLSEVGAEHLGTDLKKGRIFWTNTAGLEVCSGVCRAILSFAGTNNSLLWCASNSYMTDVPHVEVPENQLSYQENVSEADARKLAFETATKVGASFFCAAPVAAGGFVYLAVFDMVFESKLQMINPDDIHKNILDYIRAKAIRLAGIQQAEEQLTLIRAFTEDLQNQIKNAPADLKNIAEFQEVLESLQAMQADKMDKKLIDQQLLQMGRFLR